MKNVFRNTLLFALTLLLGGLALADNHLGWQSHAQYGAYLTGLDGKSLYIFLKDTRGSGASTCYDGCAQAWPPYLVEGPTFQAPAGLPGTFSTITRTDGAYQLAYNGWPLYYYASDTSSGDTLGQGVGKVWYLANVAPSVSLYNHSQYGDILTGPTGLTLYTFKNDTPGTSTCYDNCAASWPPLLVSRNAVAVGDLTGDFGVIVRKDGRYQVTYGGWPLYYWADDKQPGDTLGHGVGDVWYVIQYGKSGSSSGSSY